MVPDRDAKSISKETTFAHDIGDRAVLRTWPDRPGGSPGQPCTSGRNACPKHRVENVLCLIPHVEPLPVVVLADQPFLFERSLSPDVLQLRLFNVSDCTAEPAAKITGNSRKSG